LIDMSTSKIDVTVSDALNSAKVILADGVSADLSTAAIEELIAALGVARMVMQPQVAAAPENGETSAVVSPLWASPDGAVEGGRALAIRHPSFGWLHFIFRGDHALALADAMARDAMLAATNPASDAKN
jgi:hypothetical protein